MSIHIDWRRIYMATELYSQPAFPLLRHHAYLSVFSCSAISCLKILIFIKGFIFLLQTTGMCGTRSVGLTNSDLTNKLAKTVVGILHTVMGFKSFSCTCKILKLHYCSKLYNNRFLRTITIHDKILDVASLQQVVYSIKSYHYSCCRPQVTYVWYL